MKTLSAFLFLFSSLPASAQLEAAFIRAAASGNGQSLFDLVNSGQLPRDYRESASGLSAWHYAALNCDANLARWLRAMGSDPNIRSYEFQVGTEVFAPSTPFELLLLRLKDASDGDSRLRPKNCQRVAQLLTGIDTLTCIADRGCVDFVGKKVFRGDERIAVQTSQPAAPKPATPKSTKRVKRKTSTSYAAPKETSGSVSLRANYSKDSERKDYSSGVLEAEIEFGITDAIGMELSGEANYHAGEEEKLLTNVEAVEKWFGLFGRICPGCKVFPYARQGHIYVSKGPLKQKADISIGVGFDYDTGGDLYGGIRAGLGGTWISTNPEDAAKDKKGGTSGQMEVQGELGYYISDQTALVAEAGYTKGGVLLGKGTESTTTHLYGGIETFVGWGTFLETGVTYRLFDVDGQKSNSMEVGAGLKTKF